MSEIAQKKKSLKIIFWNPKEISAESATTIADMEDDAEGKPRSIGEFLRSLPKDKRLAVEEILGFMLTRNHKRVTYSRHKHPMYGRVEIQELADTLGLPVAVYVYERGQHTAPEFQFRVEPR